MLDDFLRTVVGSPQSKGQLNAAISDLLLKYFFPMYSLPETFRNFGDQIRRSLRRNCTTICVALHSFNDGNGRTARLLMNYVLLRNRFPHVFIPLSERSEYLLSLDEANHGKSQRFAGFILRSIEQSLRRYLM